MEEEAAERGGRRRLCKTLKATIKKSETLD
jgi:hypothetical protein